jgi:hypothetical protein
LAGERNVQVAGESSMEKTFGFVMLAVLIVVAILGFHYSH